MRLRALCIATAACGGNAQFFFYSVCSLGFCIFTTFANLIKPFNNFSWITYYESFSFVASDHVTALEKEGLNRYQYKFLATMLSRLSEKYSFNREINDDRIKTEKILLPVDSSCNPDWLFMENCMKKVELEQIRMWQNFAKRHGMGT